MTVKGPVKTLRGLNTMLVWTHTLLNVHQTLKISSCSLTSLSTGDWSQDTSFPHENPGAQIPHIKTLSFYLHITYIQPPQYLYVQIICSTCKCYVNSYSVLGSKKRSPHSLPMNFGSYPD